MGLVGLLIERHPRCTWLTRFYRRLSFGASERLRLLTVLRVQVRSGLPESKIFSNLERVGYSKTVRELAIISQQGTLEEGRFTAYWHSDGFFPDKDVRMIEAALTSGTVIDALDILLNTGDAKTSFVNSVLVESNQYLVFAGGLLFTLIALGKERATLERAFDHLMLFDMLDFLSVWTLPMALIAGGVLTIYCRGRWAWQGSLRGMARKCWVFKTYDRQFASEACRLAGRLSAKGIDVDAVLSVLSSVYKSPYQQSTLESCRGKVAAGFNVFEALDELLGPRYCYFLASMAPAESNAQLSTAFPAVAELMEVDIAEAFEHMRIYLITASLVVSLGTFFALMELMAGTNIST